MNKLLLISATILLGALNAQAVKADALYNDPARGAHEEQPSGEMQGIPQIMEEQN